MKQNYTKILDLVLRHEGGYVNHPKDPGGATNKGITQKVYDNDRARRGLSKQSVKNIAPEEVETIYRRSYWNVVRGDNLPSGVDYVVFDGGVNSGPMQSVKWLQRALGKSYTGVVDGVIGDLTLEAIKAHTPTDLINKICDNRLNFLKALKTWPTFGKGWERRVAEVRKAAHKMAQASTLPPVLTQPTGGEKAPVEHGKPAPSKAPADLAIGAGAVSATIAQAIDQLEPLKAHPYIAHALTALTIAGVILTVCGIFYRKWAATRAEELAKALGTTT